MKIKRINLKNIRSYTDQEIVFPEGSLLLAGDIGSGKSSILLALEYVLFGLQPGQKGSALLRNGSDFAEVSLEAEIEGKNIIIERGLKITAKGIVNDFSAITIDGVKTESSTTEIKTFILKLLNYPQEFIKKNNLLYRYTIYTPQEQMKQIVLEDSESRLNILRHIFGIDKYRRIRENLSILLNYIKDQSKVLQGQTMDLEIDTRNYLSKKDLILSFNEIVSQGETLFSDKKAERKKIESEVQILELKIKEKINFEKEIEKTKIMIATKKENLISLNKEISEIEAIVSKANKSFSKEEYDKLIDSLRELDREIESINKRYIEIASEINMLEKAKKENLETKERVFGIKFCPTCLQDVSIPHKHNIILSAESKISEINIKLDLILAEKKNILFVLDRSKSERAVSDELKLNLEILRSKQEYQERSRNKLCELLKSKSSLERDISFLIKHIEGLKATILEFMKFDNLLKLKQIELKKAFGKERDAEINLAELSKEAELAKREVLKLEEVITKKEALKKKYSSLLELNSWLSNNYSNLINYIEKGVMIKLRAEFSRLFNQWFNMLVPESFEAQLDENFTPVIVQSGVEMDYSFLSGGERTAVALAYRLALNQTINSLLSQIKTKDIIILDEPTEGFSEAQIDKMRDVLDELNIAQLIIVSHEQKIEDFVDSVIKIKKDTGSSKVSMEK